jgi:hypothetical protein
MAVMIIDYLTYRVCQQLSFPGWTAGVSAGLSQPSSTRLLADVAVDPAPEH